MHLAYPAVLSALLFCTGLYGVLARRNAILVLMSVELMLNAVNLNLVAFDVWLSKAARETLHSCQALTLFTTPVIYVYLDRVRRMFGDKEPDGHPPEPRSSAQDRGHPLGSAAE